MTFLQHQTYIQLPQTYICLRSIFLQILKRINNIVLYSIKMLTEGERERERERMYILINKWQTYIILYNIRLNFYRRGAYF